MLELFNPPLCAELDWLRKLVERTLTPEWEILSNS